MARTSGSHSGIINVRNSMLIVDEHAFPINLGQTVGEDTPEGSFRIIPYNGQNVLPTALGYRVFFDDHSVFDVAAIPSNYVQEVLTFQTSNLSTITIALCEEGIYWCNSTVGEATAWTLVGATGRDPATTQLRYLWTYTVVANKLCLYCQGMPNYYIFSDVATQANLISAAALFPTAALVATYSNTGAGFAITQVKPTFLNMAGQIGLYRADNRLGFWDSDNAVSWSSATQIFDMTPSTETFAGITTFSDVQGQIVKVLGHGDGFIIYATRSIVLAQGLSGSPERFAGTGILSETGVAFDTQVAFAQPDTIHFAMTSAGLYKISNGTPEVFETEVSDYVQEQSIIVSVQVVDGRYLFLRTSDDLKPIVVETEVIINDKDGNSFTFPAPIIAADDFESKIESQINSTDPESQEEFEEAQEPVDDPVAEIPEGLKLVPCWTGDSFTTNFDSGVIPSTYNEDGFIYLPSAVTPGWWWQVPVKKKSPNYTSYNYQAEKPFIDVAGEEFVQKMGVNIQDMAATVEVANTAAAAFSQMQVNITPAGWPEPTAAPITSDTGTFAHPAVEDVEQWSWANALAGIDVTARLSGCSLTMYPKLCTYDYSLKVNGYMERVRDHPWQFSGTPVQYSWVETYHDGVSAYSPILISIQCFNRVTGTRGLLCLTEETAAFMSVYTTGTFVVNEVLDSGNTLGNYPIRDFVAAAAGTSFDPEYHFYKLLDKYDTVYHPGVVEAVGLEHPLVWYNTAVEPVAGTWCGASNFVQDADYETMEDVFTCPLLASCAKGDNNWTYARTLRGVEVEGVCHEESQGASQLYVYHVSTDWSFGVHSKPLAEFPPYYTSGMKAAAEAIAAQAEDHLAKTVELISGTVNLGPVTVTQNFTGYVPTAHAPIFDAQVSGYGYVPLGGFSFRKTHNRASDQPCSLTPFYEVSYSPPGSVPNVDFDPELGDPPPDPVVKPWPYPDPVPIPDTYALYRKGSYAPFYPLYKAAVYQDLQLEKWGRWTNEHLCMFNLLAANRADGTIVPTKDKGMRAGSVRPDKRMVNLGGDTAQGEILFGRIGWYRLGTSRYTKVVMRFAEPAFCAIILEPSYDGIAIDAAYSEAIEVTGQYQVEMPFTMSCKWVNIRVKGSFNIVGISFEGEARGRR